MPGQSELKAINNNDRCNIKNSSKYYQGLLSILIRDSQGYRCRICGRWVFKYSWKRTTKKDAFDSHISRGCHLMNFK